MTNSDAEHKSSRKKHLFRAFQFIMFIIFFTMNTGTANANILNLPRLDVVGNGNVTIGSQYTFVPQATSETELKTFGSNLWRDLTWRDTDSRAFRGIEVTNPTNRDNLKGNIGVRYTNVGYYNGQKLDLKITVTNWSRHGLKGKVGDFTRIGNISFEKKKIALVAQGFNWVDTRWEYVKAGTNTRVPVSGYFTFGDIDARQGIQFSKTTSQSIDRFLIENRNNNLKYRNVSGQYRVYDTTGVDVADNTYNHRHAVTFLYSDLSSFNLRWMTDWPNAERAGRAVTPERYYYKNTAKYTVGEYLFFVINKPARTSVPKPKKSVNITDNLKTTQKVKYTVEHTIPQESSKFYYTSYRMTDTLDTALMNPTLKIEDSSGRNITSRFTTSISGNTVTITAPTSELRRSRFYGETLRYTIEGSVHKTRLGTAIGTDNSYFIKNKATARVNGVNYVSNEVSTRIYNRTLNVRHIDQDSGEVITTESKRIPDGNSYSVEPRTDLKSGSNAYKPVSTQAKTGIIDGQNATVDFYYTLPRDVEVNHIDNDAGEVILRETFKLHDGETYEYSPRTDLKSGSDTYKPVSTQVKTGTINKKNVTVDFYYTLPRGVEVNHIDNDTGEVILRETFKLHDGETYEYSPRTDLKSGSDTYKPVSTQVKTGTINGKGVIVDFYYTLPREIEINHIDDETGDLILRETFKLHDGEAYSYSPRTDLERHDGFSYKPRSTASKSGTVNKRPIEIDFFYHVPKMTVGIDRIEIDTKKQDSNINNGLPARINLASSLSTGSTTNDFVGGKVRLVITDRDNSRDVYNKTIDVADVTSEIKAALRTNYLAKNTKVNYDFKLTVTGVGSNNYELVTSVPTVKTHGYTASEKKITASDVISGQVNHTDVIRTVKDRTSPVHEYKESLILKVPEIEPQKTGYGFEAKFNTVYTNDLKNLASIDMDFLIDNKMIDSYLEYDVVGGLASITMDRTHNVTSNSDKTITSNFELPSVLIEQNTGYLFTSEDDSRIKYRLIDGGRNLYAPIWTDLGEYEYHFKSKNAIGVNLVTFDIKDDLELFAYMFSHIDSDTQPLDEIMIHQKRDE